MDKIKDIVYDVIKKISSKKPEEQIQLQEIWKDLKQLKIKKNLKLYLL